MSQKSLKKLARERKKQQQRRIQLLLLIGGGILLIAGALFAVFRNQKPVATVEVVGAPKLKVDQEMVNLGNVTLGKTVEVTFQLTNVGDEPLRFSEAPYIEIIEGC
jgi:multidrug efflux pump subunit AcrA (membrane-fusion protein)